MIGETVHSPANLFREVSSRVLLVIAPFYQLMVYNRLGISRYLVGSSTQKVAPSPSWLLTPIFPP